MPTTFPNSVDNFTDPSGGTSQLTLSHAAQHANLNDAVEAIEEFVLDPTNIITALQALPDPLGDRAYADGEFQPLALRVTNLESLGAAGGSQLISSAVLRSYAARVYDRISVYEFGAINDGTLHPVSEWLVGGARDRNYANLAAIQADYPDVLDLTFSIDLAAIVKTAKVAASLKKNVSCPGGLGYYINKSANLTRAINGTGVLLYGDGVASTRFTINLDEAYPALDFTNGKRCGFINISVVSLTTSQDTCLMLIAETGGSGANNFYVDHCELISVGPNSKAALVGVTADQLRLTNSQFIATGLGSKFGAVNDATNQLNISSKFQTIAPNTADLTYIMYDNAQFACAGGPACCAESFTVTSMQVCYFGIQTFVNGSAPTAKSFLRLRSGARFVQALIEGTRTENSGGAAAGSPGIEIMDAVYDSRFSGAIGGAGAAIGGPVDPAETGLGAMYGGEIKVGYGAAVFNNMGPMVGVKVTAIAGTNNFGTLTANGLSQSADIELLGRVGSRANLVAYLGHIPGLKLGGNIGSEVGVLPARSRERVVFATDDTGSPTSYLHGWNGDSGQVNAVAYTGGSGLQELFTLPIPNAALLQPFTLTVSPSLVIETAFTLTGYVSTDTLVVQFTQNATSVTLGTLTGLTGNYGVSVKVRMHGSGSGLTAAVVEIDAAPTAGGALVSLRPRVNTGFTRILAAPAPAYVLGLRVNSAASSPMSAIVYSFHS